MKSILRSYLVNVGALWIATRILPALVVNDGIKGLLIGGLTFMAANIIIVPFLRVLLLPLNLLTLGVFAWLGNVLALYLLVSMVPVFKVLPYDFPGTTLSGIIIPPINLSSFMVVVVASFIIGFIIHLMHWILK